MELTAPTPIDIYPGVFKRPGSIDQARTLIERQHFAAFYYAETDSETPDNYRHPCKEPRKSADFSI